MARAQNNNHRASSRQGIIRHHVGTDNKIRDKTQGLNLTSDFTSLATNIILLVTAFVALLIRATATSESPYIY